MPFPFSAKYKNEYKANIFLPCPWMYTYITGMNTLDKINRWPSWLGDRVILLPSKKSRVELQIIKDAQKKRPNATTSWT